MLKNTMWRKNKKYIRNQSLPVIMKKRSSYEAFNLLSPSDGTTLATLYWKLLTFSLRQKPSERKALSRCYSVGKTLGDILEGSLPE